MLRPRRPLSATSLGGWAAATTLISEVTSARGSPSALAISFGVRPRSRSSRTRSIVSGFAMAAIVS